MTRRVAILGLGARGTAFARAFHGMGWAVTGFDPDPGANLHPSLSHDWRRCGTISETVAVVEFVVVCLPQRIELLRKVIQRAQAEASGDTILAVATRDIDAEAVQGCAMRPGQVVRLCIDADGSMVVDTTAKTPHGVRAKVSSTLATLAVTGALVDNTPETGADQSLEADSA